MKCNYHTHTYRCMHASGTDEDYVKAAIGAGFDVLGFADHAPWPFANGFRSTIRMPEEEFAGYLRSLSSLQKQYAGQLTIHIGLEAEYFPRYTDHMQRMRDAGVEYFILGHHYADSEEETPYIGNVCIDDEGVRLYADTCCKAMQSGLYLYLAHPDLFMRHRTDEQFNRVCEDATDCICQCAKEMNLPLEYNLLGLDYMMKNKSRGYPSTPFWERARSYGNDVIIGTDAHSPQLLADMHVRELAIQNVNALGYHLIDGL